MIENDMGGQVEEESMRAGLSGCHGSHSINSSIPPFNLPVTSRHSRSFIAKLL